MNLIPDFYMIEVSDFYDPEGDFLRSRLSFMQIYKRTILFTLACLSLSLVLILLSRYAEGFAQWYAVTIYPVFPITVGRLSSLWDHSIFEAAFISTLLLCCFLTAAGLCIMLRRHPLRKSFLSAVLRSLSCITAGLILVYSLTCSINYHRDGIGTVFKLPEEETTIENLVKLSYILADELSSLTSDPDWDYSLLTIDDTAYIEMEAISTMKQLGKQEASLSGYYPKPKPIYFSRQLSKLGIEGVFSPFTVEANYNSDITPFLMPYTICHELAHLKGYMREDDAGYIAYLACRNSPSLVFQYSGIFRALIFAMDALKSEAGETEFNGIFQKLPEPVRMQLSYIKLKNSQYSSSYLSVAKKVNNAYLKANSQPGIKSYGRIVELLLSDHAEKINGENLL